MCTEKKNREINNNDTLSGQERRTNAEKQSLLSLRYNKGPFKC